MNTNIQALQALYVKLGGSLTDTYSDIANGFPVSDYTVIPDMIEAVSKVANSGGGGGDSENPTLPILLLNGLVPVTFTENDTTYYCLGCRTPEQLIVGGLNNEDAASMHSYIQTHTDAQNADFVLKVFRESTFPDRTWHNDDALMTALRVEATSPYELWSDIANVIQSAPIEVDYWDLKVKVAQYFTDNHMTREEINTDIDNKFYYGLKEKLPELVGYGVVDNSEGTIDDISSIFLNNISEYELSRRITSTVAPIAHILFSKTEMGSSVELGMICTLVQRIGGAFYITFFTGTTTKTAVHTGTDSTTTSKIEFVVQ